MLYEILHVAMMYAAFVGYRTRSWIVVGAVFLVHALASATTWMNTSSSFDQSCGLSLSLLTLVVMVSIVLAYMCFKKSKTT